jgi:hypothetical protein
LPTSFSLDGRFLAVSEQNPKSQMDLMVVSLADGKLQPFLASPSNELMGSSHLTPMDGVHERR